jgi:hypothetical protein
MSSSSLQLSLCLLYIIYNENDSGRKAKKGGSDTQQYNRENIDERESKGILRVIARSRGERAGESGRVVEESYKKIKKKRTSWRFELPQTNNALL